MLKRQKSTLLNKLSESPCALSTQALHPHMSSGDQNVPWRMASADQNVPQPQKATFEVGKWFMEAIIITETPCPILSDDKYLMVEEPWKLAIEALDRQLAFAGTSVSMPSVCQLPSGLSFKIDAQTWEAVSLRFCLMLLYQISDIDYAPKYT